MPVHNPRLHCCNLVWPLPRSLATTYGITIVFYSCGYLDVSVPRVSLHNTMYLCYDTAAFTYGGFPHSDIHVSMAICASTWLFAAYRVLLRLLVPRHSPYALNSLTFWYTISRYLFLWLLNFFNNLGSHEFSWFFKVIVFYHRLMILILRVSLYSWVFLWVNWKFWIENWELLFSFSIFNFQFSINFIGLP